MTLAEIMDLISMGESESLEVKRSTGQRTDAMKAVCGMLNGSGGHVLFGVTDKGDPIGQQVSTRTLESIAAEVRRIEPQVFPEIETICLKEGNSIIVLTVSGTDCPYTYDGRPYLRYGPTTIIMPREEYEQRLLERFHPAKRWENQPVPDHISIGDLDEEEIQIAMEIAINLGRLQAQPKSDMKSILKGFKLIQNGELLNAAVALFCKNQQLQIQYPQLEIRLARFRGRDRLCDFIDNRQYWSNAFKALRLAESYLMDHVPIAGRVVPGKMIREDYPLYPVRATREGLANALCHRDYTIPGGAVSLAMYNDHLEIVNPGVFHFGVTPEKLKRPHESHPWNPLIADVFYRT